MGATSCVKMAGALALAATVGWPAGTASAQEVLPRLYVTTSRLGSGITGASTTIVTAEDIQRAPESTLHDILSREAGVQTQSLFGGVNGAGTLVDLRGFGATAPSNTLILINGRRLNDWDVLGFDLSTIDRNSIDRIEITRGNSGAVLYGDGAVGGVINIVTKTSVGQPPSARIQSTFGSFRHAEVDASANASSGSFAASAFGNALSSDGYRDNNALRQQSGVGDFRYTTQDGSAFLNIAGDNQQLGLPGERHIFPGVNQLATDRRGTNNPFDYADKRTVRLTTGVTRMLASGTELIVDGGVRQKDQQAGFFGFFRNAFVDTSVTTTSITPRVNINRDVFGLPSRIIAGIDVYRTDYDSDRSLFKGAAPNHHYDLGQTTVGAYWQQTVAVRADTDVSAGFRIQWNSVTARDAFNPAAPIGPLGANPQGLPLDKSETQNAWHVGAEHRLNANLALFGRAAHSFRVPNVDERIGQAPVLTVTNFDLRTQTSYDIEAGFRLRWGGLTWQASVYDMYLTDELHFSPITFANVNLDPTRRTGVENIATYRVNDSVRLKGSLTYTRAVFREGPFAGNDVPVVSRWTGSAGVTWNVVDKRLVFDGVVRYVGKRFFDGDEANAGRMIIPASTVVDVRVGGEVDNLFWSFAVQNLFNRLYFDYALDQSSPGFPFFAVYPLQGRTFMFKAGAKL
jgi:iron complex outermembrane recepter protein